MIKKMHILPVTLILSNCILTTYQINESSENTEGEQATVTDAKTFSFMAAILKKSKYISAGALIDDSWVLTGADSLYLLRESSRMIRVRLGSINNMKGGYLTPIKFFAIHPYFDDSKPLYDIALIKLPKPVILTPKINLIRLQKRPRNVVATHFIVTAWPNLTTQNQTKFYPYSTEVNTRRLLTVSHLHPTDPEQCSEELDMLVPDYNTTKAVMCLDPGVGSDPCQGTPGPKILFKFWSSPTEEVPQPYRRIQLNYTASKQYFVPVKEIGAPVVLNGVLWGIVSSWKSEDCDVIGDLTFVALVSAVEVRTWIHATMHGKIWNEKHVVVDYE